MKTKESVKYFHWPKRKDPITGFYHDPEGDKKLKSSIYVPNIVFMTRENSKRSIAT